MSYEIVKDLATKMGLLENPNPEKQFLKLVEEMGELAEAILKGDEEQIKNEFGDVLFVNTLLDIMKADFDCDTVFYSLKRLSGNAMAPNTLDPYECLTLACDKVEKRIEGGKLINGVFVKKEDL